MTSGFNSANDQQLSQASHLSKDFQLFFEDCELEGSQGQSTQPCSRSSPAFSSSSSSISTLQTVASPPTFDLLASSIPTDVHTSPSISSSLFPLDTSCSRLEDKTRCQDRANSRKRTNSQMADQPDPESWSLMNFNQTLSPSGWNSLRSPMVVFSAGQESDPEKSIENWLLQQQSQAFQPQNQSHGQDLSHPTHDRASAQILSQLSHYPMTTNGSAEKRTSNYAHFLDRLCSGMEGASNPTAPPSNGNTQSFGFYGRTNAQSNSVPSGLVSSVPLRHHQRSHSCVEQTHDFSQHGTYQSSLNTARQIPIMKTNGVSIPHPHHPTMPAQPNTQAQSSSSPASSDNSPFVDPRTLFFTPRDQVESGSSFKAQPLVQTQAYGSHSYDHSLYHQYQYQPPSTYSSLNQSQVSNVRYTGQPSPQPQHQSYHTSPSISPKAPASALPNNRIQSGMVGTYLQQPRYEEPPISPFSWERQETQRMKKQAEERGSSLTSLPNSSPSALPSQGASSTGTKSNAAIVLKGPKGTQHADLPYDLSPPALTPQPPASDFATKDPEKRPVAQNDKIRHVLDRYTPKYVRGTGAAREGFCSLCPGDGKWLRLKSSAYNFHLLYAHGIDSISGLRFPAPTELRYVYTNNTRAQAEIDDPESNPHSRNTEGKCPNCKKWIHLTSGKRKPSFALFYKHMHAHGEVRTDFTSIEPVTEEPSKYREEESEDEQNDRGNAKRRRTR